MSELSDLIDESIRYYARALKDKYVIEERTEYLEEMRKLAEEAEQLTKDL